MNAESRRIPVLHLIVLFAGAVYLISGCFSDSLWFDEAFSVGLMNHTDLFEMIKWSSYDVHPHFYYVALWLFTRLFGTSIPVMRLFSALFAALFASLGLTHIRRDFGDRIGFWFTTVTFLLGGTLTFALQIRMYTLAMYLCGLTAIYAYRISRGETSKKNCVLFAVCSILAAYTHYFALFTVAVINVMLLVGTLRKKESLRRWLTLAAVQIGAYLPGAFVFLRQIKVGGADWIRIKWPDSLFDFASYHLLGEELITFVSEQKPYRYCGVLFIALYVLAGIVLWRRLHPKTTVAENGGCLADADGEMTRDAVRLSLFAYFGVILFTLAVSLVREIYYVRYTLVPFGFLVFVVAYLIATSKGTWKKAVAVLLLVGLSAYPVYSTFRLVYDPSVGAVERFLEGEVDKADGDETGYRLEPDDIFLSESFDVFVATVRYPDHRQYFYNQWNWNVEDAYRSFGPNARVLGSLDCPEINEYVGRIWVVRNLRDSNNDSYQRSPCYDYLMSLGDCREVYAGRVYLENHEYDWEFILIEKGME